MKIYAKHLFLGLAISLIIFLLPPIIDSPKEAVVLVVIGTFFFCSFLPYPIIILAVLILLLKKIEVKVNPYVISSSMIIYTLFLSSLVYIPKLSQMTEIDNGSTWQLWLTALISCLFCILFIYRKKKDNK
jgi:hypothetical protein